MTTLEVFCRFNGCNLRVLARRAGVSPVRALTMFRAAEAERVRLLRLQVAGVVLSARQQARLARMQAGPALGGAL